MPVRMILLVGLALRAGSPPSRCRPSRKPLRNRRCLRPAPVLRRHRRRCRPAGRTALRLHQVEALHRRGRPAQRPHLRRQGGRHRVWIGTEDGLALIDKKAGQSGHASWQEKDGLPWQVVTGHRRRSEDGRRLAGPVRRRAGPLQRRPLRPLPPAQQRSGQRRGLRDRHRERPRLGRHHRRVPAATTRRPSEWNIYTEKNAPMEEIWNYDVAYDGKDKVYLGRLGQRHAWSSTARRTRTEGRSLEGLPRPRRRNGDRPVPRRRDRPRDRHRRQPRGRRALDLVLLRLLPLRRPPLARLLRPRDRPAQRFHQQRQGPQRQRMLVCPRQGTGRGRRLPHRDRGGLHPRSENAPRQGRDLSRRKAAEDRRHGQGRAPQLHHQHGPRRQRHLGRDRQGTRLGHRRRILPRLEANPAWLADADQASPAVRDADRAAVAICTITRPAFGDSVAMRYWISAVPVSAVR